MHRTERVRLAHEPALDGLRGVAVAGVLAFHLGITLVPGGFLGVSTFFTLSGFLITSLLLVEHRRSGRIDLRRFWARRARRLLPAALLTVGAVTTTAWLLADERLSQLRGDGLATLGYAANWRFLYRGGGYAALFEAPSPLQHCWSLAIEEQLYVVVPLLCVAGLALRRGLRPLVAVIGLLAVGSTASLVLLGGGDDVSRAYYGTDTRAAELLAGALLAIALLPATAGDRPRPRHPLITAAGYAGLAVTLGAWAVADPDARGLYQGGLTLYTLGSLGLVAAAVHPGPLQRLLAHRPLVALGRISYGVYLYHWPVFLWVDETRTGLDGVALATVRLGTTLAIAVASYRYVEQPIRSGAWPSRRTSRILTPAAWAGALAAVVLFTASPPPPTTDLDGAEARLAAAASGPAALAETPALDAGPGPAEPARVRMTVFGDSTATMAASGLLEWAQGVDEVALVGGGTLNGCGIVRHGRIQFDVHEGDTHDTCNRWAERWPAFLADHPADIAVVLVGPWDVADHRQPGDDRWRAPGDPVYDALLASEITEAATVLSRHVVTVVWLTSPVIDLRVGHGWAPSEPSPGSDPARIARLNEIILGVAEAVPRVEVVDLAGYLRALPGGELDPSLRPDGVHFSTEGAATVAAWLGPAILEAHAANLGRGSLRTMTGAS